MTSKSEKFNKFLRKNQLRDVRGYLPKFIDEIQERTTFIVSRHFLLFRKISNKSALFGGILLLLIFRSCISTSIESEENLSSAVQNSVVSTEEQKTTPSHTEKEEELTKSDEQKSNLENLPVPKQEATPTYQNTGKSYINVDGQRVPSPVYAPSAPAGATARCRDGTYSFSQHRSGTCSHHGGVAEWL